ncbi:MAG: alcohol dehydrogenase catalytic domain-containing protein [Nitrospinae bacterium]|nr:alcohol dehydrogenase catalytic domain-containing protein [Nitrospinota bacterium]
MRALALKGNAARLDAAYPAPSLMKGHALIRPLLAGICATDLELIKGYLGFNGVLGHEFVGVVEECPDRPELAGARVTGEINLSCGQCPTCLRGGREHCPSRTVLGIAGHDGCFADYLTLPIENLHIVPSDVPDTAAVFAEPLAAALRIRHQVNLGQDTRVAALGDGRLGLLAAQALSLSDCDLLVIGRHRDKLAVLERQGIPTALADDGAERAAFDVVVDSTGSPRGFAMALELVRPRGTVVLKTTVANPAPVDVNRLVIHEITVIGSRLDRGGGHHRLARRPEWRS